MAAAILAFDRRRSLQRAIDELQVPVPCARHSR
jgi:hypothetical protein